MSQTVKETVKVDELSKYGFKTGDTYYNWSKKIDAKQQGQVTPGGTYEMELYIADSGKKYVNTVILPVGKALPKTKTEAESKPKAGFKAVADTSMTREDWDAKDRRISRQGVIQVAVQVESVFTDAEALADKMLEYVNRK